MSLLSIVLQAVVDYAPFAQMGAGIGAGLQAVRVHYSPPQSKGTAATGAAEVGASRDRKQENRRPQVRGKWRW